MDQCCIKFIFIDISKISPNIFDLTKNSTISLHEIFGQDELVQKSVVR